jgi:hypothetical protein
MGSQDILNSPRAGGYVDTGVVTQIVWETCRMTHLILFEGAVFRGFETRWNQLVPQGIAGASQMFNIQGCLVLLLNQVVPQFLRCERELTQGSLCRHGDRTLGQLCTLSSESIFNAPQMFIIQGCLILLLNQLVPHFQVSRFSGKVSSHRMSLCHDADTTLGLLCVFST